MTSKRKSRVRVLRTRMALFSVLLLAGATAAARADAQTPSQFMGTIIAVSGGASGNSLTVKTDQGQAYQVEVPAAAAIKRIEPGQKSLSGAETIEFSDLGVGDRALVRLDPNAPAGSSAASLIVAIKAADVAEKRAMEREEWQRRGVGGLVKSVDPATGAIVLTSGAGPMAKTITVQTTQATRFLRYAPDSVRFDEARPAPISAIQVGDQLRARGEKNEDGTEIAAAEVVSGSFRNISGRITAIDPAASRLTVKDLATKKPVLIHITAEAQMRRLPDRMATLLGALLKGDFPAGGQGRWAAHSQWGGAGGEGARPGGEQGGQQRGGWNRPGQGGGFERMLDRAPEIQLSELKKGEAVMVVSTEGKAEVTAITLVAGVEPLLESPEASRDLLSSWSMNSGGGASEEDQ